VKRQLDVYGLWKFSPNTQLRLSAGNLSPRQYFTGRTVVTPGLATATTTDTRTYTTFGVRLETRL
jgi:iron complex outermembrane receptor protein